MRERSQSNFLERLRATDDKTKRKIMIITSLVCMALVIYAWIGFFGTFVSGAAAPAPTEAHAPAAPQFSFAGLWDSLKSGVNAAIRKISAERQYYLKGNN